MGGAGHGPMRGAPDGGAPGSLKARGRRWSAALLPVLLLASWPAAAQVERQARESLRVCADGHALPFSNEKGEGLENKLAEMIAADLGVKVEYTWWPQTYGFVRQTLGARRCDIVMGTASGEQLMQNTNPYYRSTYALVYRADSGLTSKGLDDPALQGARVGVVTQTPAVDALLMNGISNIEPYQLATDTRVNQPARDAVQDVAEGKTDAAVLWGPLAGYWAKRQDKELVVVPLVGDAAQRRMMFNISMGIRPDEPEWKRWLNDWIKANQGRIDALLVEYGVPLVGRDGQLKAAARDPAAPPPERRAEAVPAPAAVAKPPEPEGYRTSDYRAPVPATLKGAAVLAAGELERLTGAEPGVVLLDVLPSPPPRPDGRGDGYAPRPHETIPGAVWLPDTGFGEPSPAQDTYLRSSLEALTKGRKDTALVVFCKRDCWHSWNVAKRALALGYTRVHWMPDGVEGWQDAGRALATAAPYGKGPQG